MAKVKHKLKTLNELSNGRRARFIVVKIGETEYWTEEIASKAGRAEEIAEDIVKRYNAYTPMVNALRAMVTKATDVGGINKLSHEDAAAFAKLADVVLGMTGI